MARRRTSRPVPRRRPPTRTFSPSRSRSSAVAASWTLPNRSTVSTSASMYPLAEFDHRWRQADEIRRRPPGCRPRGAAHRRQARRDRREDVAAVKRRRHRLTVPLRLRQLDRLGDAAERVRRRQQQPIVRTDEQATVGGERDRTTRRCRHRDRPRRRVRTSAGRRRSARGRRHHGRRHPAVRRGSRR